VIPVADSDARSVLAARYDVLAAEWREATAFFSSTSAMVAHPAYQAIIGLGWPAVPLLLRDLEQRQEHWFKALRAITGEDPVAREIWGNIPVMAAAWLAWGRERGLI
jgi:hypothetical protein